MPSPSQALDLLLMVDAQQWEWTLPALMIATGQPPTAGVAASGVPLPGGGALSVRPDRDGVAERLVVPVTAGLGMPEATQVVARRLGPYVTARRGLDLTRSWPPLPSGRRVEAVLADGVLTLELVRAGVAPPPSTTPAELAEAAAELAVRIAEAGYVPVEDETLPDMAAALGGRLAWAGDSRTHRRITMPHAPWLLELVDGRTEPDALTWYPELRMDLWGSADVAGSSRLAGYELLTRALVRRWGPPGHVTGEARFWHRDDGWTVAADTGDRMVRLRIRTPHEVPVRPPE